MTDDSKPEDVDVPIADSVAIRRLIEEVRAEDDPQTAFFPRSFNRTFNRHNR